MQEWIIAMLVISVLLIFRDMAKTVFNDKNGVGTKELLENHPQKEQIEKYAASFQKLADTYQKMEYHKNSLTNQELENIFQDVNDRVCERCQRKLVCWGQQQYETYRKSYDLLRTIEQGETEKVVQVKDEWAQECLSASRYMDELKRQFYKARQNLIWSNKLIENRLAVAGQLGEMAQIMDRVASELYSLKEVDYALYEQLEKSLRKKHILLRTVWSLEKNNYKQYFVTLRARSGQCIPVKEVTEVFTKVTGTRICVEKDGKNIINGEFTTLLLQTEVNYQVSYGVARVTKEKEMVSGDSYSCNSTLKEQFAMCLSDGMGSGLAASKESESVVELLEQFINSGFSREAAVKMVNSTLVMQQENGMYSTVDICSVDLYTGEAEFLKAGAAASFIKRPKRVEMIASTSMALGLIPDTQVEITKTKLEAGDYIILISDGVLDALPVQKEEETMRDILSQTSGKVPRELGKEILQRVLAYSNFGAMDDMTVLVAAVGQK